MYEPIDAPQDATMLESPRAERRPFAGGRLGTLLWLQAQDTDRAELGDKGYYEQSIY